MKGAEDSFRAALLGIRTLAECYLAIDEPSAAFRTLSDFFKEVLECATVAAEKSRLVAFSGAAAPQEMWEIFVREYPRLTETLGELRSADAVLLRRPIEIEFRPHELKGDDSANLPEVQATRAEVR